MMKILARLVIFTSLVLAARAEDILKAKRIVFLGDSITHGGAHIASFAAYLDFVDPDPERVVLNLGLPSETVSGLSEEGHAGGKFPRPVLRERLARVLDVTQPDLLFACYGINCAIYQKFDEGRFEAYRKGILELADEANRRKIPLILMTPWPFDAKMNPEFLADYNEVLARYSRFLIEEKGERWKVLDVHTPMSAELVKRRAQDPEFAFTGDGIHPNEGGGWYSSTLMLRFLGEKKDARDFFESRPNGQKIHQLASRRMKILRDAYVSAAGHKRPGMSKGLPLDDANKEAAGIGREIAALLK